MNKEQIINYILDYEAQIFKIERDLSHNKQLSQEYYGFEKEYYKIYRRLVKNEDVSIDELNDLYKKIVINKLYYGKKLNNVIKYINLGEKENLLKRIDNLYNIEEISDLQSSIDDIYKYLSYLVTCITKLSNEDYNEPTYSDSYAKINNKFAIQSIFEDPELRNILNNDELNLLFGAYINVDRFPEEVYTSIKPIIDKIWKYEITQEISEFKNGDNFCFLVHNFTTAYLQDSIDGILTRVDKSNQISTSLITNDNLSLYTAPMHKYGFIYPGDSPRIMAGHGDLYSGEGNNGSVFKNKEKGSKFFTPKVINYINKKRKQQKNMEIDDNNDWNESIIEGVNPIGLFYISYGEGYLDEDYQKMKVLADQMKLPFIEIDARVYRKKIGLEEYNEQFHDYLIRLLLQKNNIDFYSSSYNDEFCRYKENIEQIMNIYEVYTSGNITMEQFLEQVKVLDNIKSL